MQKDCLVDEFSFRKAMVEQLEIMVQHLREESELDIRFLRLHAMTVLTFCDEIRVNEGVAFTEAS